MITDSYEYYGGSSMILFSYCDTYFGQSGSALFGYWDGSPYVVAVVSAESPASNYFAAGSRLSYVVWKGRTDHP